MKKVIISIFLAVIVVIIFGCKTKDYEILSPYGDKNHRDLEVVDYTSSVAGRGDYRIFAPAGGEKQYEYKELGWRLFGESKPRSFISNDKDGFVMELKNIPDGKNIVFDGFGYYKFVNDDYGYNLIWQDFDNFVKESIYQVSFQGRQTVAIKLIAGKIYKIDESVNPEESKLPWQENGLGNEYSGYEVHGQELVLWGNGNMVKGSKANPYFFGNFSGDENQAWQLIPAVKDPNYKGWWSITFSISQDSLDIYYGWGGDYDETSQDPFANTNFEHMPFCYGWGCGADGENGPSDKTKDIYLKIRNSKIEKPCE